jgi:hypothetical protein
MTEIFFSCIKKKNSDYFLSLIISGIIFWVVNFFGLGYTNDSHLYIEIAKEINSTDFLLVEGFNIKPPALPILIFLVGVQNMSWINFLCYLCIQGLGVYWSRKITDRSVRYSFLIILVFATPHILISSFMWTEPLFLSVMLFSFYLWNKFHQTNQLKFMVPAIILLLLLPFIRFAGIFLIFPLLGFLLLTSKNSKRLVFVAFLVLLCLSSVWVFFFMDGFSGRWERFIHPLLSGRLSHLEFNLSSYSKALSSWFFPYAIDGFVLRLISISIMLATIYKSSKVYFKQKRNILFLSPLLCFIYFLFMMLVFKVEYYAAERYLSIFYLLIILNIFLHLDHSVESIKSIYFKWSLYLCIIIFALYSFLRTIKNVYFWYNLRSESVRADILENILVIVP